MAFPTTPTTAAGRVLTANQLDSTATRTFPNLSGLTKNSGDLLIAIVVGYQSNATANAVWSGWTAGWTEFLDYSTTTGMCIGAAYKWSTGSETGTISVTQAATITGDASMILLSIAGAHASTPPEGGSGAQGTSAAADPATFNPAGWDVEDTLWISVIGSGMTSGSGSWTGTGATAPTNFTGLVRTAASDTSTVGDCEAAVSFRQNAVASEDVAAASGVDTSNARNAAVVIAVRPAAPPAAVPTDVRVSFPTPSTDLVGSQEFRAQVRRKEASAPAVNPTVAIELWESGAKVADVVTGVAVTSTAGQVVSGTWQATALAAISGANVECKVVSAGSSLGTVEVGAIEWNLTRVAAPEVTGTAVAALGALTAVGTGAVNHPGVVSLDLGAFTTSASGLRETFGTVAAGLGGTATAAGLRETSGVSVAALGGLSATASGGPVIAGAAAANIGVLTATASGATAIFGTAAASSSLTATSSGFPWVPGTAVAGLGALTATSAGLVTVPATAVAAVGVTTAATGLRATFATAGATLGGLSASMSSIPVGQMVAAIGMTATAVGLRTTFAVAPAGLGGLSVTATGAVETNERLLTAALGGVTATASGVRQVSGTAALAVGVTIAAQGAPLISGNAQAALGPLAAVALGAPIVVGQAVADLGALTAVAAGGVVLSIIGTAEVDLPGIAASAVGTRVGASSGSVTIGFTAVAIAFPHQLIRSPRAGIPTTGRLTVGVPIRGGPLTPVP